MNGDFTTGAAGIKWKINYTCLEAVIWSRVLAVAVIPLLSRKTGSPSKDSVLQV